MTAKATKTAKNVRAHEVRPGMRLATGETVTGVTSTTTYGAPGTYPNVMLGFALDSSTYTGPADRSPGVHYAASASEWVLVMR